MHVKPDSSARIGKHVPRFALRRFRHHRAARRQPNELPCVQTVTPHDIANATSFRLHSRPVMTPWCRKLVLVLALVALPLQSIAATMTTLRCHTDGSGQVPHTMHAQDGHDHDMSHDDGHVHDFDGSTSTHALDHFCFHHFASALLVIELPEAIQGFQVLGISPPISYSFFIPDRPQRPPLA